MRGHPGGMRVSRRTGGRQSATGPTPARKQCHKSVTLMTRACHPTRRRWRHVRALGLFDPLQIRFGHCKVFTLPFLMRLLATVAVFFCRSFPAAGSRASPLPPVSLVCVPCCPVSTSGRPPSGHRPARFSAQASAAGTHPWRGGSGSRSGSQPAHSPARESPP